MKGKGESFWQEVRRAYENGEGSYQTLADRFGGSWRGSPATGLRPDSLYLPTAACWILATAPATGTWTDIRGRSMTWSF